MNIYFQVMSKAKTPVEAMKEAHELAQNHGDGMGVTVRVCGTQQVLATVFKSGGFAGPNKPTSTDRGSQ